MKEKKNLKFTNDLKRIGPKLKWFLFTEMQDLKLTSDYIDFICPGDEKKASGKLNPVEDLRNMVEGALVREFTPNVRKLRSFNHIVDAVMYNVMKKSFNDNECEAL